MQINLSLQQIQALLCAVNKSQLSIQGAVAIDILSKAIAPEQQQNSPQKGTPEWHWWLSK